jgi:D-sedoheptulose 7-phosphate isomerase
MRQLILDEVIKTQELLAELLASEALLQAFERAARLGIEALENGRKIMFCGNGGSAADSQHLAAELVSQLNFDRPGLAALALTTDSSILTAIGNDYGYERVFARQVEAIADKGDVLVAISTSGRSRNIIEALKTAASRGVIRIGLTGRDGRDMTGLCDQVINIPTSETQKIQEGSIIFGHIFCALIERAMFPVEA